VRKLKIAHGGLSMTGGS